MKIYINLTNLMIVPFVTGIQRVVIETILRLLTRDYTVVLVEYLSSANAFCVLDNDKFIDFYKDSNGAKSDIRTNKEILLSDIEPDAIYYDIDSVWNNTPPSHCIYKELKVHGTRIATYIYDVVPISFPHFSHKRTAFNFMRHFSGVVKHADIIFVSTEATKRDIEKILNKLGINKEIHVTSLAYDSKIFKEDMQIADEEIYEKIDEVGEFLLSVGTVEPRKNHKLLLKLLDLQDFKKLNKAIVIVGRAGWNTADVQRSIRNHTQYNKTLFWFDNVDDSTLAYIYSKAYALLFTSYYEGFGLPIIEALSKGVPVISSKVDVLEEVGGDYARYFELDDEVSLYKEIAKLSDNHNEYIELKNYIAEYSFHNWDYVVDRMCEKFDEWDTVSCHDKIEVSQIVILTARSTDVLDTLEYIVNLIDFIKEVVIVCPNQIIAEISSGYNGVLRLVFISDEELIKGSSLPKDHSTRNFFLRTLAFQRPEINDYFISYDDDSRPLRKIDKEFFITNNKINAHYYYKLHEWHGSLREPTSFDTGQFQTRKILEMWDCPTLSYCSHMPQVMSKKIWKEIISKIDDISTAGMVEWTFFYNYGIKHYPHMFNRVKFKTLCWPALPSDWAEMTVTPDEFAFENYYEGLYEKGGLFEGFSKKYTASHIEESIKKIAIREEVQKQYDAAVIVRKTYASEYQKNNGGLFPSFTIQINENGTILNVPSYLVLQRTTSLSCAYSPRIIFSIIREVKHSNVVVEAEYYVYHKNKRNALVFQNTFYFEDANKSRFETCLTMPQQHGDYFLVMNLIINEEKHSASIPLLVIS